MPDVPYGSGGDGGGGDPALPDWSVRRLPSRRQRLDLWELAIVVAVVLSLIAFTVALALLMVYLPR